MNRLRVGQQYTPDYQMGIWQVISTWIRQMVKIEPKVMREVSKAEFGSLSSWIERGEGNVKVCGCLVGTVALALADARNHFKADPYTNGFSCTTNEFATDDGYYAKGEPAEAYDVIGFLSRKAFVEDMQNRAASVGGKAATLGNILGQESAVALIKDEIVRALKRRQAAKRRKLVAAK